MSLRPATSCPYHSTVQRKLRSPLTVAQIAALIICLTPGGRAQQTSVSDAPFNINAYRIGERLTYNVNYSRFVSAAHIELFVAGRDKFFGQEGIQLKAHVETKGIVNVTLLAINNDYTTYVFPETGLPYRAQHVVRQAGQNSENSIDYTQPPATPSPARLNSGDASGTLDLLSAVYRVRAMPLTPGASYYTTVRNEGEEYRAQIKVDGKELIRTSVGSFDSIATHINMKSGEDYDIHAYFSNDEWHVPVLVTARHRGADIQIELGSVALAAQSTPPTRTEVAPTSPSPRPKPTPTPTRSAAPVTRPLPPLDLPFKVGEQLNYRVYLGKATTPVGSANFEIKTRGRFFNRDGLQIIVNAQTTGPAQFGVRDQITSYLDPATLLPFRTEINFTEGKYHVVKSYNLDQDLGNATKEGSREQINIPVGTHDLVSAFYSLRTFDLTPKKKADAISAMTVDYPRVVKVESLQRETIELNGQKIAAIALKVTTDDPQPDRLQIRIWVGDDGRHLPLRIAALTDLGPVHADLIIVPSSAK